MTESMATHPMVHDQILLWADYLDNLHPMVFEGHEVSFEKLNCWMEKFALNPTIGQKNFIDTHMTPLAYSSMKCQKDLYYPNHK